MQPETASNITFPIAIALTALWYYIKYVLRQNRYETHLFWGHFKDIVNLHSLHNQEQDLSKKQNFKILLFAFYAGLALFLITAVMMFSAS